MKKPINWTTLVVLAIMYVSCNSPKQINEKLPEMTHSSRNSLDWDGIYRGVLPCADCKGIQTTVYLDKNLGYRVKLKYLGKESNEQEYTGKFSWNKQGNTIILAQDGNNDSPVRYFVGESTLTRLDNKGNKIAGEHAVDYVLSKANYAILEKYWKLTELNGIQVMVDSTFRKEPHIILKDHDNRINGNGGCNNISGSFEIRGINRISFSNMITTKMACANIELESSFLKALEAADHFNVVGDILMLNNARMAPLARFRSVYMK